MGGHERARLWRKVRFAPLTLGDPGIERLSAALRRILANWAIIDRGLRRLAALCATDTG